MVEQLAISERRACRLAGLSRTSLRRSADTPEDSQELRERIRELAYRHERYGYRRIHDLLRIQGLVVNHKRIWQLYREQNLAVHKRRKAKRPDSVRVPRPQAVAINEVWSMDFVSDSLANGRRIKCLTVVDDFSREAVDIAVDYGISGAYVVRLLDQATCFRGYPQAVRTDQGPEFTCRAFMAWAHAHGIEHLLNVPGKPTQSAYIESFNGKFRDECLNEHWFESLGQARREVASWRRQYNELRPHSSIGRIPPATFAAQQRRGDQAGKNQEK